MGQISALKTLRVSRIKKMDLSVSRDTKYMYLQKNKTILSKLNPDVKPLFLSLSPRSRIILIYCSLRSPYLPNNITTPQDKNNKSKQPQSQYLNPLFTSNSQNKHQSTSKRQNTNHSAGIQHINHRSRTLKRRRIRLRWFWLRWRLGRYVSRWRTIDGTRTVSCGWSWLERFRGWRWFWSHGDGRWCVGWLRLCWGWCWSVCWHRLGWCGHRRGCVSRLGLSGSRNRSVTRFPRDFTSRQRMHVFSGRFLNDADDGCVELSRCIR